MKRTVHDMIYLRLENLGLINNGQLTFKEYLKLKSSGFMDLNIDVLEITQDSIKISLAHNYEVNGDLVPDPDMEIRIYPDRKSAEALTFQDSNGYRVVYPEPGKYNPKAKKDLNQFLNFWLKNLISQGFKNIVEG